MDRERVRRIAKEAIAFNADWQMLERAITLAVNEALEEAASTAEISMYSWLAAENIRASKLPESR